jgi:hypothetical protein
MEQQEIIKALNTSVEDAVRRNKDGYTAIYALLLTWEDKDDPAIELEVERLADFLGQLGATVDPYSIPSEGAQAELQQTLSGFMSKYRHVAKHSLFILYYSGHGDTGGNDKRPVWTA